jgi:hypothetical protein
MFRDFRTLAETGTATSLLWFPTIQRIKREQDPAYLALHGCFVSAQAIERKIGQIGECEGRPRKREVKIQTRAERIITMMMTVQPTRGNAIRSLSA